MFSVENRFNGSLLDQDAQTSSVPPQLLSFIRRLLGGASEDDGDGNVPQSIHSLTQLLYSNSVKRRRKDSKGNSRQQRCRETPIAIYAGLLVHNATGSADLVDALFQLGLSISYDRVQEIRKKFGDQICEEFLKGGVVWGYSLPKSTPKAYGFDNANKISSSNTASGSANFNGTVISVFSFGETEETTTMFNTSEGDPKKKLKLPEYYTNIEPVDNQAPVVPSVTQEVLVGDASTVDENSRNGELPWMNKVRDVIKNDCDVDKFSNVSWAAFFASNEQQVKKEIVRSQILPVFIEEAATPAMVRHCLSVILKAHEYTNPGEVPWVTADQPLFALLKTIQWRFPDTHGEHKLFGVMGALHIEKASWTCVGQVEDGSGTPSLMADANVTTIGVAESCLNCSHISRSRYLNTVSACVLYMLLRDAYQEYVDQVPVGSQPMDMDRWCEEQKSPMFCYHYLLLKLKLLVLQFVRSVRSGNKSLYLTSLTKITYYFFALNHVHYARWTPVHIRDMIMLPEMHPEINRHFEEGRFTINKTGKRFSNIGLDHGQEQNIKHFKEHGGPLPFTHSPDQLLLYLVAGPEVTNQVSFFQNLISPAACSSVCHHEQTNAYQNMFIKHTKALYSKYVDIGNVFTDESNKLYDLCTDEARPPTAIDSIMSLEALGKQQYEKYVEERLVSRSVPITERIKLNKLNLMKQTKKAKSKTQEVKDLKNLAAILSQLYVASHVRGGDTTEFFSHENVPNPPSLSKDGYLYHGTKSDLADELAAASPSSLSSEQPRSDAFVLDGPAVIHMIKPKNESTIDEYCETFLSHIQTYFYSCNRVDVIFYIYLQSSLKDGVRETRGVAPSMIVRGTTKVKNWSRFLKNGSNKQSFFEYIALYAKSLQIDSRKQLVITCRDSVITNPKSADLEASLSPCDHEEADTRMLLHMDLILQGTVSSITLRTVDTDVLVLAVAASNRHSDKQIWVNYGVGEHKKIFAAHEIRIAIGSEKAAALPVFHAFTGCDTVSSFKAIGKKTAWERWKSFNDVTEAFLTLSGGPEDIDEETRGLLERFAILLYDKTSPQTSINLLRKELFTRGRSIEKIPPTSGALLQHDRRTTYQGGHCWGKMTERQMLLPPAELWGWYKKSVDESYVPLWTLDPIASKACRQLTKCGCSLLNGVFKCIGNCGCRRSGQPCTELCKCKGSCKWLENKDENNVELDIVDEEDEHIMEQDLEEPLHIDNEDVEEYAV